MGIGNRTRGHVRLRQRRPPHRRDADVLGRVPVAMEMSVQQEVAQVKGHAPQVGGRGGGAPGAMQQAAHVGGVSRRLPRRRLGSGGGAAGGRGLGGGGPGGGP